ncbi:hypothetical protein ACFPA8_15815 [Streptomyces ovatisporus]|uniref:Secreted protein n=1 Tax=Streptomyces ovatisporus TaxID=1128682 RepID=A0ABV9A8H8_9ACTN
MSGTDAVTWVAAGVSLASAVATVVLGALFEQRRQRALREEARRDTVGRYAEPLLQAATALRLRLANAVERDLGGLLDEPAEGAANRYRHQRDVDYYLYDTLYRIGCYLGWSRVLHQEPRYLDVGSRKRNVELMRRIGAVSAAASEETEDWTFQLWTGETWVLGDLMIDPDTSPGDANRIISALRFHHEIRENPDFVRWFAPLIEDFGRFAADRNAGRLRLIRLHNALGELITFLDPHGSDTRSSFEPLPLDDGTP